MVTIQYVFQCDVCGQKAATDQACSLIWGIDWKRPTLPDGWKILTDGKSPGAKLICYRHVCDIRDSRYTEMIEAVTQQRRAGVGS
jgi:hypothetical protein